MPTIKIQNTDGQEQSVTSQNIAGFALDGNSLKAQVISADNEKLFEAILFYLYSQDVVATGKAISSLLLSTKKL